jgi:acetyltransferase-like isoleucine patch superfamily enzyme
MANLYLTTTDHAFASGPVFVRPESEGAAIATVGNEAEGSLLWAVFESYERSAELGQGVRLGTRARLVSKNAQKRVKIGANCAIRGIIRCESGGQISIGDLVYIGDDVIISAQHSIEIGELTLLAHGVQIFDNDSHPADADEREAHFKAILGLQSAVAYRIESAPVKIGRRCWIGFNSAIMKGVTIGDDSIVAAGSMVTKDVPAGVIVAGNPARIVKSNSGQV